MRTLLIVALLLATSSAKAWTLPDFGYTYFVGTTEELNDIRAALREAECQRLGPEIEQCNYPGPHCFMIPNPYCGTNTYSWGEPANLIPAGLGLGEVDCMQSYEDYTLWPTTETIASSYLGNTYLGTYVSASEELFEQSELPEECISYLEQVYCLAWGPEWADMLCPDP